MNNTMRNPFTGELWEGLIYSVDIDKALDILEKAGYTTEHLKNDEFRVIISPKYANDRLSHYLTSEYIDDKIPELLKLTNNIGYFPSFINYYIYPDPGGKNIFSVKYSSKEIRDALINEQPHKIWITFNKKFDDVVNEKDLQDTLYHLTESKYINKIKNIGLKPSAKEKLKSHRNRIYFSIDKEGIELLKQSEKFKNHDTIVVIETGTLKNVTFYYDPDFFGRGIYTHDNIPASNIIDIFDIKDLK